MVVYYRRQTGIRIHISYSSRHWYCGSCYLTEGVSALYGESYTSSNICRPIYNHHSCADRYVFIKFGIRRAGWWRLEFRRSPETVCSESALSVASSVVYVHLFAQRVHKERSFMTLCANIWYICVFSFVPSENLQCGILSYFFSWVMGIFDFLLGTSSQLDLIYLLLIKK